MSMTSEGGKEGTGGGDDYGSLIPAMLMIPSRVESLSKGV
jgi:hypothetical protein